MSSWLLNVFKYIYAHIRIYMHIYIYKEKRKHRKLCLNILYGFKHINTYINYVQRNKKNVIIYVHIFRKKFKNP